MLVDSRDQEMPAPGDELSQAVCPRRTSVGADGLIVGAENAAEVLWKKSTLQR